MATKVFLAVSRNDFTHYNLGRESFWCFYKNSKVLQGDLLLMYKSKHGIYQVYEVIQIPSDIKEFDCQYRDMVTVKTKLLLTFENPLTFNDMKNDDFLSTIGPVRRKFQNLLFTLKEDELDAILSLIKKANPGTTDFFKEYTFKE